MHDRDEIPETATSPLPVISKQRDPIPQNYNGRIPQHFDGL
jgi:hypothetical protein